MSQVAARPEVDSMVALVTKIAKALVDAPDGVSVKAVEGEQVVVTVTKLVLFNPLLNKNNNN